MKTTHRIVFGDSRYVNDIPDKSVHLIITSPPYWQLKDYGDKNQLGFYDSYEDYINNLNLVWLECSRVIHDGCRLCINIGDQFARSVYYGRYKIIPIRTEITKFCECIGLDYMGAIIWQKVTTCNTTGGATVMGSFPYPRNGILKLDYEFILIFRKLGTTPKVDIETKEKSRLSDSEWNEYFSGHWNFPGEKQNGHLAMYPEELPKRLIKMFSYVGDTILDPFLGSGTTSLAAANLGRNSIGYEINENFEKTIREKLHIDHKTMFSENEFIIVKQPPTDVDFNKKITNLPYIFKDPVKFDKKIDIKKLTFGSKIDSSTNINKDKYYRVKAVISPELIVLDSGLKLRLLGVRAKDEQLTDAVEFLKEKTKGVQVFIKFDSVKYNDTGDLLGYLYLKNKTLLNAHLIKNKLVHVDASIEYSYKKKFLQLKDENND